MNEKQYEKFSNLERLFYQYFHIQEIHFDYIPEKVIDKAVNRIEKEILEILEGEKK